MCKINNLTKASASVEEAKSKQTEFSYSPCPIPSTLYVGMLSKVMARDIIENNRWNAFEEGHLGVLLLTKIELAAGYACFNIDVAWLKGIILELDVYFREEDVVYVKDIKSDPNFQVYSRQYESSSIPTTQYALEVLGKRVLILNSGRTNSLYFVINPNKDCEYFTTDLVKVRRTYWKEEYWQLKTLQAKDKDD